MLLGYASLVLLVALVAGQRTGGDIVFPGPTGRSIQRMSQDPRYTPQPATLVSRNKYQPVDVRTGPSSRNCPFPPPEGITYEELDKDCYEVTDEEEEEDMIQPLSATETQCSQGFLRHNQRCLKIVQRPTRSRAPSKNKAKPSGSWTFPS